MRYAQAWILTFEVDEQLGVHGLLTVCGDTTNLEPESYEFGGSWKTSLSESVAVLDATIWSFLAITSEGQNLTPEDHAV